MVTLNRTAMANKYKGKWVALKSDRKTVVVSGSSAKGVFESAKVKGIKNPIITHIPSVIRPFAEKFFNFDGISLRPNKKLCMADATNRTEKW